MKEVSLLFKSQLINHANHLIMKIIACPDYSGVQTIYDIVKAHGGVPIAIGMKSETQEREGSEFIIQLN